PKQIRSINSSRSDVTKRRSGGIMIKGSSMVPNSVEAHLRRACADTDRCLRAGGTCHAEDFLAAWPDVSADADSALELIYTEFVLREELGQQPSPEEWYRRFPQWREDLRELFEVDRWVHAPAKPSTLPPAATLTQAATLFGDPSGSRNGLASYGLLEEIGRGGMGVVYRARQLHLDRIVALKMTLLGDCAGAEEVRRFREEAAALASLQDANIVQIYEVGEDN